jgi:hypothetical protein
VVVHCKPFPACALWSGRHGELHFVLPQEEELLQLQSLELRQGWLLGHRGELLRMGRLDRSPY